MAEREEKTYEPLPRRRERAREQGEVARSVELTSAVTFLVMALILSAGSHFCGRVVIVLFRAWMGIGDKIGFQPHVETLCVYTFLVIMTPLLMNMLVSVLVASCQGGFIFAPVRALPNLSRLSLGAYFSRLVSVSPLEVAKAVIKCTVILYVGWHIAVEAFSSSLSLKDVARYVTTLSQVVNRFLLVAGATALVVALIDYGYRRWQFERQLRMTRQELKEELRQEYGDPNVRRAIRKAQQRARKRFRGYHQAASATVVLTNPTQIAVALRYRRGFDQAPLVVAKGAGQGAARIVLIAKLAAVPVLVNRPLARALYRTVEVGDFIPQQFYRAVAEVLAFVIRSTAKHGTKT